MADEKIHIPAKPAAATLANVAGLAAAGVVAGGTLTMALAAGGAAAAVAAGKASKKAVAARRSQTQTRTSKTTSGGGGKGSGLGKSGSGSSAGRKSAVPGGSAGRKGTGTGGSTGGSGRSAKGSAAGTGGTAGRKGGVPSLLSGRSGKGSGGSGGGTSRGSGRKGTGTTGGSAGKPITPRWARRFAKVGTQAATRSAKASGRVAAKGGRKAATGTAKASRNGFRKARKWVQKNLMGRNPQPEPKKTTTAVPAALSLKEAFEKGLINSPVNTARRAPIVRPVNRQAVVAPVAAVSTQGGPMLDLTRQILQTCEEYDAPGVLEIIDYLESNLPGGVSNFAEGFRALSSTCRGKWPFDDAIVQKLGMIAECLDTAAQMSKTIVPDIESIHASELQRLRSPGVGQEKFDLSANGHA